MRKKNLCRVYPLDKSLNKRWYVTVLVQKEESVRLKFVRWWIPNHPTIEKREAEAEKIVENFKKNGYNPKPKQERKQGATHQLQLLFELLEEEKPRLRRSTRIGFGCILKVFNDWCVKEKITMIKHEHAQRFFNDQLNLGKKPKTVNTYRGLLNSYFLKLIDLKRTNSNPFAKIKSIKSSPNGSSYFKTVQIEELKTYMLKELPFLWFAVRYNYYCFIRPGELRQLKIGNIDFDEWLIKVPNTISKNKKEQFVVIPDALKKEIAHLRLHSYPSDFFLVGRDGLPAEEPVPFNFWSRHHLIMLRQLKYSSNYNLYSWKHTGVCRAYKAGIGLKELQLQLRHHSLDMVKVYLESLGILDFKNIKEIFPAI